MTALQVLVEIAVGLFAAVIAYRCFSEPLRRAHHASAWGWLLAAGACASLVTALGLAAGWSPGVSEAAWLLRGVILPGLLVARAGRDLLGSELRRPRITRPLALAGGASAMGFLHVAADVRLEDAAGQTIPRISTATFDGLLVSGFALGAWTLFLVSLVVLLVRTRGVRELDAPRRRARNLLVALLVGSGLAAAALGFDDRGAEDLARITMLASDALVVGAFGITTLLGLRWELQRRPSPVT